MTIWFFIWLILSCALLYFLGWTLYILFRQKRVWKDYAAKNKLRYNPHKTFESPDISGVYNGRTINLFTAEHMAADERNTRKMTAAEVTLSSIMPFEAVIASGGMASIGRGFKLREEVVPAAEQWDKGWLAAASHAGALEAYLTPERMKTILGLLRLKNTWVMLVFRNNLAFLRIDTPDPLDDQKKLDSLIKKMTAAAIVLDLKAGEDKRLADAAARNVRIAPAINPATTNVTFELEQDEAPPVPPAVPDTMPPEE